MRLPALIHLPMAPSLPAADRLTMSWPLRMLRRVPSAMRHGQVVGRLRPPAGRLLGHVDDLSPVRPRYNEYFQFQGVSPTTFFKLMKIAKWESLEAGTTFVKR